MKKVLSTLLIIVLLFSSVSAISADSEKIYDEYDMQLSFLNELGIIDSSSIPTAGRTFTRGEFAVMAAKLLGERASSGHKAPFMDVDAGSEFASSINLLVDEGCITGNPDGTFRPGEYIAPEEAVKILVEMLGYGPYAKVLGGYPLGYYKAADKIELTWGAYPRNETTVESIIKLLYNALHTPMLDVSSISTDGEIHYQSADGSDETGKTLLSAYFDIYYTEGIFESTSTSSLYYNRAANDGEALIGGNSYRYDSRFDRYLGYHVYLWHKVGDSADSVFFVYPSKKNSEVIVSADEDMSLQADSFIYYRDNRKSSVKLSSDVSIIYNNSAINFLEDYNEELLDFDNGNVKLINNDNDGDVDVVKITSYQSFVIDSIEVDESQISVYGAYSNANPLKLELRKLSYSIVDSLGKSLTFNDLKPGDVLSYAKSKDGKNVEILVSYNYIEGQIEEIQENGQYIHITVNGDPYTLLKSAITNDIVLKLSGSYTFYIGASGYIVALTEIQNSDMEYGYVLGAYYKHSLKNKVTLYYINSENERVESQFSKKPLIDGKKLTDDEIISLFEPADGEKYTKMIMKYRLNDEGLIYKVDTGKTYNKNVESPSSLRLRFSGQIEYDGGSDSANFKRFYNFISNESGEVRIGNMYGYDPSAVFFVSEPAKEEGADDIDIDKITCGYWEMLALKGTVDAELYATNPYSGVLSAVVLKNGSNSSAAIRSMMYIVADKKYKLAEDDEYRLCLTLATATESVDYFTADAENFTATETSDRLGEGIASPNDINVGDIIIMGTNFDGYISKIQRLYDYEEDELLVYDSDFHEMRLFGGWVYNMEQNIATIAPTGIITDALLSDGFIDDSYAELYPIPNSVISYEVNDGEATVSIVTPDAVLDYVNGENDCDRLLIHSRYSNLPLRQVIKLPLKSKRR